MAGVPTRADVLDMVDKAMLRRLQNVCCANVGDGKFMAMLQLRKLVPSDEGWRRRAALLAFSILFELEHTFLVSEDVDPFGMSDVLRAVDIRS